MPFYYKIDSRKPEGRRTAERLLLLRHHLAAQIPRRTLNDTLLLATWNIREFDSPAYGERVPEAFYYIAEILSRFDLVAVQEIREDLKALRKVQRILGSNWKYVVSDVTQGTPGNRERLGFLYDSRKITFSGLAGELVIPPKVVTGAGGKRVYDPADQLYRTPFLVGFTAGWFKFILTTVHMVYGKDDADDPKRVEEIRLVADFLQERAGDASAWSPNLIALGDFNIFSPEDVTMEQLTNAGFVVPRELQRVPATNVGKKRRHYDQIAFQVEENRLHCIDAGVFDFFEYVFTQDDQEIYTPLMGDAYHTTSRGKPRSESRKGVYYRTYWRTHQMSDHLVMWVELGIDFGAEYLRAKSKPR